MSTAFFWQAACTEREGVGRASVSNRDLRIPAEVLQPCTHCAVWGCMDKIIIQTLQQLEKARWDLRCKWDSRAVSAPSEEMFSCFL